MAEPKTTAKKIAAKKTQIAAEKQPEIDAIAETETVETEEKETEKTYIVAEDFRDKQDYMYLYKIGEVYPREGQNPSAERIEIIAEAGLIKAE
jgi:hypothetical protein